MDVGRFEINPPIVLDPIVLWDTRSHSGSESEDMINEGSAGEMFDMPLQDAGTPGDGYWFFEKRNDGGGSADVGNNIFPTDWDDFGGTLNELPIFWCTVIPDGFLIDVQNGNPYHEVLIDTDNGGLAGEMAAEFWSVAGQEGGGTIAPIQDGFAYTNIYDNTGPELAYQFTNITLLDREQNTGFMRAHFLDWQNGIANQYLFDGSVILERKVIAPSTSFVLDEWPDPDTRISETQLLGATGPFPAQTVPASLTRMWMLQHRQDQHGPLPGLGEGWDAITGFALARPKTCSLDYIHAWWTYFR